MWCVRGTACVRKEPQLERTEAHRTAHNGNTKILLLYEARLALYSYFAYSHFADLLAAVRVGRLCGGGEEDGGEERPTAQHTLRPHPLAERH